MSELWGDPQYRIVINNFPLAAQASNVLEAPFDIPDGSHQWRIVTIDRRGQETLGLERRLNIDTTKPVAELVTLGTIRAGQSVRFVARDDPPPPPVPAPARWRRPRSGPPGSCA